MSPAGAPSRFAAVGRAGPLLLTSGFAGAAGGGGGEASALAYKALTAALARVGAGPATVARLDHFTASQGWLGDRQQARAAVFGRPAPLASTGVATVQPADQMLDVAAMALAEGSIAVVAEGAAHGMPAIAAAVRGGPFLFVSGVLTAGVAAPAQEQEACLAAIERLLADQGIGPDRLLRVDAFASEDRAAPLADAIASRWPGARAGGGGAASFSQRDQIEVNALGLLDGVPSRGTADGIGWAEGAGALFAGPWIAPATIDAADLGPWLGTALARFCAVLAVGREHVARIELRLPAPEMAEPVSAALAAALPPGCRPSLLTWFAPQPAAMMITLDRRHA